MMATATTNQAGLTVQLDVTPGEAPTSAKNFLSAMSLNLNREASCWKTGAPGVAVPYGF